MSRHNKYLPPLFFDWALKNIDEGIKKVHTGGIDSGSGYMLNIVYTHVILE